MGSLCFLADIFAGSARFHSWNSRGLLSADPELFKKKWAVISSLLPQADVLVVQETHGSLQDCKMVMSSIEHAF